MLYEVLGVLPPRHHHLENVANPGGMTNHVAIGGWRMLCGLSWQDSAQALYAGCPRPSRDGDEDGGWGFKGKKPIRERGRSQELRVSWFWADMWASKKKRGFGLLSQLRRNRSAVGFWVRVKVERLAAQLLCLRTSLRRGVRGSCAARNFSAETVLPFRG